MQTELTVKTAVLAMQKSPFPRQHFGRGLHLCKHILELDFCVNTTRTKLNYRGKSPASLEDRWNPRRPVWLPAIWLPDKAQKQEPQTQIAIGGTAVRGRMARGLR